MLTAELLVMDCLSSSICVCCVLIYFFKLYCIQFDGCACRGRAGYGYLIVEAKSDIASWFKLMHW